MKHCIDKSVLNNKINFWTRNKSFILVKSSNLITKNLNKIFYKIRIKTIPILTSKNYPEVNISCLLKYIFIKYFSYIFKKFFIKKRSLWKISTTKITLPNILNKKNFLMKSKILTPPLDFEWADPFIFRNNQKDYIFFENNDLKLNRGKISCGLLYKNKLINVKDVLIFKYHLSYPFLWRYKRNIFLIPESSSNKSIQIWKSTNFPYKWKIFKTIFKNEYCCDTTIITDNKKNNWLFTNKSNDHTDDPNNELYVYKIIGNFDQFIPHKLNPVITDCRIARNAGNLNFKDIILRPSQINDSSGYGLGVNINKITSLSLENYEEKIIKKIYPLIQHKFNGLHHISNAQNRLVFDIRK